MYKKDWPLHSGEESGEASFTVYIIPAETEKLLYGMTALISRVQ